MAAMPTPQQRQYMEEIVRGMQAGEMGMVAKALSGAVSVKVSIPDHFLSTVKQWMDSRQQSAKASAVMTQRIAPRTSAPQSVTPPTVQGPDAANFEQLHRRLEDAIRRNDTQAMSLILQQAAKFAAARGSSAGLTPSAVHSPSSAPQTVATSATPLTVSAGAPTPIAPGGVTPGGMTVTSYAPGGTPGATPYGGAGAPTPIAGMGAATPKIPITPRIPVFPPVKHQLPQDDNLGRPLVPKAEIGRHAKADSPQYSPGGEPEFFDNAPWDADATFSKDEGFGALGSTTKFDPFDMKPGLTTPASFGYQPTVQEIADFLRKTVKDTATFRQICQNFQPQPVSEGVRRTVESAPTIFTVTGDRVTLTRDPNNPESLAHFTRELTKMPFTRKQIDPEEACEFIWTAANHALQSRPSDVVKLLTHVQRNCLRKASRVYKGLFPANMPLVIACVIDRIVMSERRTGGVPRFESAFGPQIYNLVFQKWILGNVPGSQFLANLLLMWERLGYFEPKHLEPCKKPLLLILAYAPLDGVVDSPHKDNGTGWYKVIQRSNDATARAPEDAKRKEKRKSPIGSEDSEVKRLRSED